jgi:hypothetical protein
VHKKISLFVLARTHALVLMEYYIQALRRRMEQMSFMENCQFLEELNNFLCFKKFNPLKLKLMRNLLNFLFRNF